MKVCWFSCGVSSADGVVYDVVRTTEKGKMDCDFCDLWDGKHCPIQDLDNDISVCPVPNNHHLKRRETKDDQL